MSARTWASILPLQSPSSLIRASISREGDAPLGAALFFVCFICLLLLRLLLSSGQDPTRRQPAKFVDNWRLSGVCHTCYVKLSAFSELFWNATGALRRSVNRAAPPSMKSCEKSLVY